VADTRELLAPSMGSSKGTLTSTVSVTWVHERDTLHDACTSARLTPTRELIRYRVNTIYMYHVDFHYKKIGKFALLLLKMIQKKIFLELFNIVY